MNLTKKVFHKKLLVMLEVKNVEALGQHHVVGHKLHLLP
jgi:hypothetical protein